MRLIYLILLSILITVSTVSIVFYPKQTNPLLAPPVVVEAVSAHLEPWQDSIQAVGSLSANQGTTLKSAIAGRVVAIYFQSGENVKVGTPLLQLNPDILKGQLDAAKAETQLSKADYERGLTLYKKKVFAKAEIDKISATYQANLAKQEQAQAALNQALLTAPFSGRLGLRLVNVGDIIDPNTVISDLEAIDPLYVNFNIPGIEASKIAIGNKVLIHTSAYPKKIFVGTIYALDSHIDNDTRSLAVRASLNNSEQKLLPGAFVDIKIEIGKPQTLFIVPETSVSTDEYGSFVYRIVHHQAIKTFITIHFHDNGKIGFLSSDIHPGDQIISVGGFKVQPHSNVVVGK